MCAPVSKEVKEALRRSWSLLAKGRGCRGRERSVERFEDVTESSVLEACLNFCSAIYCFDHFSTQCL